MLTAGKRIAARQLWVGRPAKHLRDLDDAAVAGNRLGVEMYVENGRVHKQANGL
jgi:carbonic anhydrase/acetyltransferase-like protein (isoleucine patch superfamily)